MTAKLENSSYLSSMLSDKIRSHGAAARRRSSAELTWNNAELDTGAKPSAEHPSSWCRYTKQIHSGSRLD